MCLLVVCSPNSTPKREDLNAGACHNPHGFGFAIEADGKIISVRGMSAKKIIKQFLELRKQYPNGYAMWHARIATHGVKNEDNCHPFKVGGSDLTYLAHNGILDVPIPHGDKRSDTRILAEDTLPRIGGVSALDDDVVWTMVSKWASGSKIAVLTVDPSAKETMYIVNEKLGSWDNEGVWWSNQNHKPKPAINYYSTYEAYKKPMVVTHLDEDYTITDYSPKLDECPYCYAIVDFDENPYYCDMCQTCYDCEIELTGCMCYVPTNKWSSKQDLAHLYEY